MPLAPEYASMLAELAGNPGPALQEMTPEEGRELYRLMRPLNPDLPIGAVRDETIPGPNGEVPLRIYTPAAGGPCGIFINYHGGGWVIGDLDTSDGFCRGLAEAAHCVVVSVDYRLAPEHRYPAAVTDSFIALSWVAENTTALGGNGRLAVGGESAGANLAAVMALKARDEGGPQIDLQLLAYPVVDADMSRPSYVDNGSDYILTTESMMWFWDHYCPDPAARQAPDASPLHAASHKELPPALILTAEFDPLRDEGELYGEVLNQAGSPAEVIRFDGLVHDFLATAGIFEVSRAAFNRVAAKVKSALAA